jgi:5-methylcytosine-specific restriction endonuclease McrA
MTTPKLCEHCAKPLAPTPSQFARGLRTANKRFCNHACAAQAKSNRVPMTCPQCQAPVLAERHRLKTQTQVFCSKACYDTHHAATPVSCATCQGVFVPKGYSKAQRYCCIACVPKAGADNPNFGKRHPGMFAHSGQFRLWLSAQRMGENNPAWKGGSKTTGAWQHQTWIGKWAKANLEPLCAVCSAPAQHVHHIVPGRFFSPRMLMQFRQNLVMLCDLHQRNQVDAASPLLALHTPRLIPFADRLPEPILQALEQGGLVSSPLAGCDYLPLGKVGELIHSGHWLIDKA